MAKEFAMLKHAPYVFEICPACGARFPEFLRGEVQRSKRFLGFLWKRPYCAVICHVCKDIIGWEQPRG